MPFRFTLAPLLRLRQSIERQLSLKLQEANLHVSCAQEKLEQLERSLSESAQSDAAALQAGRTPGELQFASVLHQNPHLFQAELQSDIPKLEILRQQPLGKYRQAYRERKILETLGARQRRVYQQEQLRHQQRE